ncbi:helix-turn-helix domain-containing protein [Rhodoplanes roseus]|uniref:Uncharacterized protein n=1 Tax=Rhodoplanes roseus TaxID=29409 RepID=A0A327L2J5_9BRAD|nr:helix-turn-helix domain-containing protein [Rhodoplanes roseus]RAI44716.1 hypothetical protein CH341_07825 [Rhodoplanes roseus]
MSDGFSDDGSAAAPDVDLFGAPVTAIRERWGRPSFAKTKENQELVCLLRASGWTQQRICRYLGCDEKTLRKYFSRELEEGADRIEGMALEVLLKKMRLGDRLSATKLLELIDDKGNPAPPVPRAAPKEAPLGKKAQLEAEARTGHSATGWGDLLEGGDLPN